MMKRLALLTLCLLMAASLPALAQTPTPAAVEEAAQQWKEAADTIRREGLGLDQLEQMRQSAQPVTLAAFREGYSATAQRYVPVANMATVGTWYPTQFVGGHWRSSFADIERGLLMVVLGTAFEAQDSLVQQVRITSLGDNRAGFNELAVCAFGAVAGLENEALNTLFFDVLASSDGFPLDSEEPQAAAQGYTLSVYLNTSDRPVAVVDFLRPLPVTGGVVIDTTQRMSATFAGRPGTAAALREAIGPLRDFYYDAPQPLTPLQKMADKDGERNYLLLLRDNVGLLIREAGEPGQERLTGLLLMGQQPSAMVQESYCVFAALTGMGQEDLMALSMNVADQTSYEELVRCLPRVAKDGVLMLYGVGADNMPAAYFMDVPQP